jgi:hypothetical protein
VRDLSGTGWRAVRVALIGGVSLAASLGLASPQFNGPVNPNANGPLQELDRSRIPDEQPYVAREMQARQLKRLREEHQKQVFSDTARLVQLATELKSEVDKSDAPTADALKDVDEIGKLAKRVSERIKTQ